MAIRAEAPNFSQVVRQPRTEPIRLGVVDHAKDMLTSISTSLGISEEEFKRSRQSRAKVYDEFTEQYRERGLYMTSQEFNFLGIGKDRQAKVRRRLARTKTASGKSA